MLTNPDRLCEHVKVIATQIGPRPATSFQERSAARYVAGVLAQCGLAAQQQNFRSHERFSKRITPSLAAGAALVGAGLIAEGAWRRGAGLLGLALAWHYGRLMRGHSGFWEHTFADGESRNVVAVLPPRGAVRQRVVLVAHLDTDYTRFSTTPAVSPWKPWLYGAAGLALLAGSLINLMAHDSQPSRQTRMASSVALMGLTLATLLDETAGYPTVGANHNASGIAVLLTLAETLTRQPLDHTEVWMVFTGGGEVGGTGLAAFIKDYARELQGASFVIVKGVGAGELCWVTESRLSAGLPLHTHPEALAWAERAAAKVPELGIMGRAMSNLGEIAVLNHYNFRALTLTGYDRISGDAIRQSSGDDQMDGIQAEMLLRAAQFVMTLLQD